MLLRYTLVAAPAALAAWIALSALYFGSERSAETEWNDVNALVSDWLVQADEVKVSGEGTDGERRAAVQAGPVDINLATIAELDTLPGIGPAKAQAIVEYRDQHGPFQRAEDIMEVKGIGAATFAKLEEKITVSVKEKGQK